MMPDPTSGRYLDFAANTVRQTGPADGGEAHFSVTGTRAGLDCARASTCAPILTWMRLAGSRHRLPLWALFSIWIICTFLKGRVTGVSASETVVSMLAGCAVIAAIIGFAVVVEKRINR